MLMYGLSGTSNQIDTLYDKYILCYVDDLLHIGFKPKEDMDVLNMIYQLNEWFGLSDQYLGANFEKLQLKDGQFVCSTNCVDCLKSAIEDNDNSLRLYKTELKKYRDRNRPYSSSFSPELEVTE